jgi:hypothetical protein
LSVTESIFITIRIISAIWELLQFLHRAIPIHLEIDADTTVHGHVREMNIEVGYASFYDLAKYLLRLLIVCHSHANCLSPETTSHAARNPGLQFCWKLKEAVYFPAMLINDRNTIWTPMTTGMCGFDDIIEKFVVFLVRKLNAISNCDNKEELVELTSVILLLNATRLLSDNTHSDATPREIR